MKRFWFAMLALVPLLTACPASPPSGSNAPVFRVDPTVQPIAPSIPGLDGMGPDRPLGRLLSASGSALDFTLNELLIATDDSAKLNGFLSRWKGSVLQQIDFSGKGLSGVPKFYLVKIDPGAADPASLPRNLLALAPGSKGENKVSSDQTLKLLAVAAQEAAQQGLQVGLNVLFHSEGLAEGSTSEAPGQDACSWPYMNRFSPQDFGVCAAWQALAATGKLSNKVKVMVMDGGFVPNPDLPAGTKVFGGVKVKNPDPSNCNGFGCPWHGTDVATALAGVPDNGFGAAGPAGPVADLILVQSPALDFWQILNYLFNTLPAALSDHPRIINISAAVKVDWGMGWAVKLFVDEPVKALRKAGTLVFAAAGNLGENVDTKNAPFSNEDMIYVPCEADDVVCVGGLSWDSVSRDPKSDYGEDQRRRENGLDDPSKQDNSVDLYGPFTVYGGPEPDSNGNINGNLVRKVSGTSVASPFVAGVAALVWAANPNLSADDVYRILLQTAKPTPNLTPSGKAGLRVDAFAAVKTALGVTNVPPTISVLLPKPNSSFDIKSLPGVAFEAKVSDLEDGGQCCEVTWYSSLEGLLGTTDANNPMLTHLFKKLGTHTITATAKDSQGATNSVNFAISLVDNLSATILAPADGQHLYQGTPYTLEAQTYLANATFTYTWTSSNLADGNNGNLGSGAQLSVAFGSTGSRTITLMVKDNYGTSASASVNVVVDPPPPQPTITQINIDGTDLLDVSGNQQYDPYGIVLDHSSLTLKGTASGGTAPLQYRWTWQYTDGAGCPEVQIGTGSTLTWTFPSNCFGYGHGNLTLYVTDANAQTTSKTVHLYFYSPPH